MFLDQITINLSSWINIFIPQNLSGIFIIVIISTLSISTVEPTISSGDFIIYIFCSF